MNVLSTWFSHHRRSAVTTLAMLIFAPAMAAAVDPDAGVVNGENSTASSPFSTHRANYLVLGPEHSPYVGNVTSKFQLSLKYDTGANWFFAYTQRSYWDINSDSSPAVDHNFEPEMFYRWRPKFESAAQWGLGFVHFGILHQSNGRSGADSRAWNRAYAEPRFHWDGWFFEPKVWVITSTEDQNRDIADYAGYADVVVGYETTTHQRYTLTGRQGSQHGSVQFDVSMPLSSLFPKKRMRPYLYFQAWAGYGETLLYYNQRTTAYRFGIEFHP
jgi:outer membrane phospholipase A